MKGIEMDVDIDKVCVTAAEESMNQAWINLIHNGIKFTPNGGSTIHLKEHNQSCN